MSDRTVVLDRPEQISAFQLSVIISGLRMEVNTGMKMSRVSPKVKDLKAFYRLECGNTKKSCLAALEALKQQVDDGEADYELRDGRCFFYPGAGS